MEVRLFSAMGGATLGPPQHSVRWEGVEGRHCATARGRGGCAGAVSGQELKWTSANQPRYNLPCAASYKGSLIFSGIQFRFRKMTSSKASRMNCAASCTAAHFSQLAGASSRAVVASTSSPAMQSACAPATYPQVGTAPHKYQFNKHVALIGTRRSVHRETGKHVPPRGSEHARRLPGRRCGLRREAVVERGQ